MKRVHIAFVSPEHCDIAADLTAVANGEPTYSGAILCSLYGADLPTPDKPFSYSNGLAFIPMHGLLVNRFPGSVGFATGYDFIRNQMHMALDDPDVSAIVYDINSSGGMAAGCGELAQEIYESRGIKPSLAVVNSNCYSGAYYLGSAASRLVSTPSGGVGSIGVVAMHADLSKMLEQDGIEVTFIHAGDEKVDGNPYQPLSDRAKASIENTVQYHYGMFTESVARFRAIPEDAVRATEARCLTPPEALKLGLIDDVASSADAIRGILGGEMSAISQDEVTRIAAEAAARAVADDRARISAIRSSPEAVGREKLADHLAFSTSMAIDEAQAILSAAPKQEAPKTSDNAFAAAMETTANPNVGPDNAVNTAGESVPNRILANYGAVTGYAYRKSA